MAMNALPILLLAGAGAFLLRKKKPDASGPIDDSSSPPPPPPDFDEIDETPGDGDLSKEDIEKKCDHFIDLIYSEISQEEAASGAIPIENMVVTETIVPKVKAEINKHIVSNSATESAMENFGLFIMNGLIQGCLFTYHKLATDPNSSVLRYLTTGKIAPFKANEIFHGILMVIEDIASEVYPGFTVIEDPPTPQPPGLVNQSIEEDEYDVVPFTLKAQTKP